MTVLRLRLILVALTTVFCLLSTPPVSSDDKGWRSLFDGKTLDGWTSPGRSFFSVQDGALTGETTRDHQPRETLFIVRQGVEVRDFELRFKFRLFGPKANSGMQFRSWVDEQGRVHGYQADIAQEGPYTGGIWDEYSPRGGLAGRGQRVVIDESGKKTVEQVAKPEEVLKGLDLSKWNDYTIIAKGPHIVLKINGRVTAELTDRESGKAASSGAIATAIIPGEPMKAQYKDIRLRVLD